ncbi:interferon-induced, double-stranded RNA-activated protein kinase [Puntigrus tetrazona]|uniref:interferon-induced, double-stranded RNA-activated protein kinase n=1 Tax=Puntigrus tetrazona TaxID=1606681 RepID=UPI001C8AB61C|nr:interferon-induced, double-stranded RNA-activated protein kinase [Puntigrus tetrazona]
MDSLLANYIAQLNVYQQKTQCSVEYEEGSTDGPSHDKTFAMRAVVNGQRYPEGTGKSKKEAKLNAAKNALNGIHDSQNIAPTVSNYVSWLNEYSQKKKLSFKPRESTKMNPGNVTQLSTYVCKYICGDKVYPEALGKNKRDAKEAAAKCVYEELLKTQDAEVFDDGSNRTQRSEVASRSASLDRFSSSFADESRSTTPDSNYIAQLNHYCQKHKRVLDFKLVDKRGPAHSPEFVYKAVLNKKEYPEGRGKSSKEAKQQAARHAWNEINDRSGWTAQSSEDESPSQAEEASNTPDAQHSSETPSSSSSVVFKNSSAAGPPLVASPGKSALDVKPKIKLAANFNLSPNGLAGSREVLFTSNGEGNEYKKNVFVRRFVYCESRLEVRRPSQAAKSRFLEDFDSISAVGKGGRRRVFKARRIYENTYYAVKIVKSTKKARREVGALAKFNNPNIVRYYVLGGGSAYRHDSSDSYTSRLSVPCSSGSDPGTKFLYIQMEFCEGDTLRAWIDRKNSPNAINPERRTEAARIHRQVLEAVEYIHKQDLIHRDLKPLNIMFSSDGKVKVGDFGLVTAAENENDEQLLERTKRTGTRVYMSPEQANQTSYDRKVDIYALGLIYFELIWNLFTSHEKKKIWDDIRRRDFPPQFSKNFNLEHKLIARMLSPSPEERPDASELIRELDRHADILSAADKDTRTVFKKNLSNRSQMSEMERKICDFLRENGRSKPQAISIELGVDKSTVNKHLYNLERSNHVIKTDHRPPVWELAENNDGAKRALGPGERSRDVEAALRSGGKKAHRIAEELGESTRTVKRLLYSLEEKGKAKRCGESSLWTLNGEQSFSRDGSCPGDPDPESVSGLSCSFDVIATLGEGGYGCVYKVKHKIDGGIYAVKRVVLTRNADSEVKALARLDHPNIVRYVTCWPGSDGWTSERERGRASGTSSDFVTFDRDGCEEDDEEDEDITSGMESLSVTESASAAEPSGSDRTDALDSKHSRRYLFIQMDFCEGGTLTNWIKERNFMGKQRIITEIHRIFYEIVTGVEYIHANKLIHRDLKPDNMLFGADGKVKIGDFGLVAAQTDRSGDPIERSNRGTASYMSPEQKSKKDYDEKTDIFPLGLVLFVMIWEISTVSERDKLWPGLRDRRFPEGFGDRYPTESKFIVKMLSYSPEHRPHAKAIKEEVEKFFSLDHNLSQKTV